MANVVVVGAQWGDEGKAKVIDWLSETADVIIRCQGGSNAGHTVKTGDEVFKFHLVPSGILYPNTLCLVGSGTVIDPEVLLQEIDALKTKGYDVEKRLRVSIRAHITLPVHIAQDKAQEAALSSKKIGTTCRGIGPTYMDKVGRLGIRIGDLYEAPNVLRERLTQMLAVKNPLLTHAFNAEAETVENLMAFCQSAADKLRPYVDDTVLLAHKALRKNQRILFEGAQGTLLDVDYGTYPFVTSSNATAGGACTGSGIGPTRIDQVVGVMKAYVTRVGEGPFPTELADNVGKHLVDVGQEYGTTTGRLRRCGWFDAILGKYSAAVNGLDSIALTKLDVFDGLPELKIAVAYRNTETGERVETFPSQVSALNRLEPVYETLPGWQGSVQQARSFGELPEEAKRYVQRLAELLETPIALISVGPARDQTLILEHPMETASQQAMFRQSARQGKVPATSGCGRHD